MTAGNRSFDGLGGGDLTGPVAVQTAVEPARPKPPVASKPLERIVLRSAGFLFSPQELFAWIIGLLGVGACIAPWFPRGWLWFGLIATPTALLACLDAIGLWRRKEDCVPVLLLPEKGLRGREGESIQLQFAVVGSASRRPGDMRVAVMPATQDSQTAIRVDRDPHRLKFAELESAALASGPGDNALLWPWTAEIALLRRGSWAAPRVGIEWQSRLRVWRLRRWFDVPAPLRIDANLRPGRQEILRSPVYRMLVASQQSPWTGHGREFERLREYQPGDMYSEIAWKSTARRSAPVTRLFQWEQKQGVYFVVDQSRASALALEPAADGKDSPARSRAPQRMLDLAVETALIGATVALELGDEFGLVTYADEVKSWLRAGSGQAQFHRFRDSLLNVEPLPTNADYETLFSDIRVRLRRRAYLILLADLTERSISDSLRRGVGLVRSSHAVLMTSILPDHARPAFSTRDDLRTDQDVYAALAADKENQRLGALARQLRQLDVQLRYVPAEAFLRTAVERYLESKREQRL